MLIAAMILGIIGGISYFVGGGAGAIGWGGDGAPWWVFALMPIGVLGAMGAMRSTNKPNLGGIHNVAGGCRRFGRRVRLL